MLDGVKTFELGRIPDERGYFCELLRRDWRSILGDEWIAQANLSCSYPNVVRAWHRHLRGQVDYFAVVRGALKICAYDDDSKELDEIIASEHKPQLVRIPGHYWHGTKTIGNTPSLTVYFTTMLYDYDRPDEERRPWNDPTITPESINGKKDDPRVGKPWNWMAVLYK